MCGDRPICTATRMMTTAVPPHTGIDRRLVDKGLVSSRFPRTRGDRSCPPHQGLGAERTQHGKGGLNQMKAMIRVTMAIAPLLLMAMGVFGVSVVYGQGDPVKKHHVVVDAGGAATERRLRTTTLFRSFRRRSISGQGTMDSREKRL